VSDVNLVRNRHLVEDLGGALRSGQHGLSTVPGLLKRVLQEESWREFTTQRGEHIQHDRFVEFVTTPPLAGIGATVELLQRLVGDDVEARDLLDRAVQNPAHVHLGLSDVDNIKVSTEPPRGTSKDYALRKLRKDDPELHADVLAGRLSAHAAMVKAGHRPPTFTVRADSAEAVAKTLRRRLDAGTLAAVRDLLEAD
jgi:hypothetical protein